MAYITDEKTCEMLKFFRDHLPQKPYCSDNLRFGLKIRPRDIAAKMRYIQPNDIINQRWLGYDLDDSLACHPEIYLEDRLVVPAPNIIVANKENGHAHYLYGLETPVYQQMTARKNPIKYASVIDVALTKKLDADINYTGLIVKNPLSNQWETQVLKHELYTLGLLADWLDLSKIDLRKRVESIGLGRNCNLFDVVRNYGYREIRKINNSFPLMGKRAFFYTQENFINSCIEYARNHNTFIPPLPDTECRSIGKSVGKWVFENMSSEGFREWCRRRGRSGGIKSGEVRAKKMNEKILSVKEYRLTHPNASVREIAIDLNICKSSVSCYLK